MSNSETKQNRSLKTVLPLVSLVAIAAIVLTVYAFNKKMEADEQAAFAKLTITKALEQQKIALEQRNIADSNKEQALQQRELALESERNALMQAQIAGAETRKAEQNRLEAMRQQYLAQQQKLYAATQTKIAESNAEEAKKQLGVAEVQRTIASDQKQISSRLKELQNSRNMAAEAVLMINEQLYDSSKKKAIEAYLLNNINNGPEQNNDIYGALNINWAKSISNKNQFSFHGQPVHSICGIPNSNIIFTADESGMLYESALGGRGLQKIASYAVKEEIRALAVSPHGNKLVAVTAAGNGSVFKVSPSGMSFIAAFKFQGMARSVAFDAGENILLVSDKGIGRYQVSNLNNPGFLSRAGISGFAVGKSGKIYLAVGNHVKIYGQWADLANDAPASVQKFDSKVSSVAVDVAEQYMAAGTYNGYVWISSLKNNTFLWGRPLHISSVNDLEFATVNNNTLQLASAGADQSIKLVNVPAVIQRNAAEDIITLKGHSKWIYSLYYAENGKWLCSAGEDSKVIAWKPTMYDLFQSLTDN